MLFNYCLMPSTEHSVNILYSPEINIYLLTYLLAYLELIHFIDALAI